jgi:excisionase family DNA binding protein
VVGSGTRSLICDVTFVGRGLVRVFPGPDPFSFVCHVLYHVAMSQSDHTPETLYTVDQVAAYASCDWSSVYRLIREGDLRHVRIGKRIRVPASALDAFLAGSGEQGGQRASTDPDLRNALADALERIVRREVAKELEQLAQDEAEDMLSEADYGPDATAYRAVTVASILERAEVIRNG